jgi:hypothetical protein
MLYCIPRRSHIASVFLLVGTYSSLTINVKKTLLPLSVFQTFEPWVVLHQDSKESLLVFNACHLISGSYKLIREKLDKNWLQMFLSRLKLYLFFNIIFYLSAALLLHPSGTAAVRFVNSQKSIDDAFIEEKGSNLKYFQ